MSEFNNEEIKDNRVGVYLPEDEWHSGHILSAGRFKTLTGIYLPPSKPDNKLSDEDILNNTLRTISNIEETFPDIIKSRDSNWLDLVDNPRFDKLEEDIKNLNLKDDEAIQRNHEYLIEKLGDNPELLEYFVKSQRTPQDDKFFVNWIGPANASKPQVIKFNNAIPDGIPIY